MSYVKWSKIDDKLGRSCNMFFMCRELGHYIKDLCSPIWITLSWRFAHIVEIYFLDVSLAVSRALDRPSCVFSNMHRIQVSICATLCTGCLYCASYVWLLTDLDIRERLCFKYDPEKYYPSYNAPIPNVMWRRCWNIMLDQWKNEIKFALPPAQFSVSCCCIDMFCMWYIFQISLSEVKANYSTRSYIRPTSFPTAFVYCEHLLAIIARTKMLCTCQIMKPKLVATCDVVMVPFWTFTDNLRLKPEIDHEHGLGNTFCQSILQTLTPHFRCTWERRKTLAYHL